MQQKLVDLSENNTQLVAVSPMMKNITSSLVKKLGLDFPVLCDQGNQVAKKYGLVFTLAESVQPIYKEFGIDLPAANGDSSHQLPLPATYIIDQNRTVRYYFVDADHTTRLDPSIMLHELKKLT